MRRLVWYMRRLRRMSAAELAGRVQDFGVLGGWWVQQRVYEPRLPTSSIAGPVPLPESAAARVPSTARDTLIATADKLLDGKWTVFDREVERGEAGWDWFLDPRTGRRSPSRRFAPLVPRRDETRSGNVKYLWELSRHHHLTVLAVAFFLSRDERYAERIGADLTSWWGANPFLTGIHWTSGIEVGIRLLSWTWVRRLLSSWAKAPELFETNPLFARQLVDHQRYLARLRSHGSSANNHLIAELVGLFVSTCAFPLSPRASRWRDRAARELLEEMRRQVFPDGIHRELATEYHGFVLELLLAAALEGEASSHPLDPHAWEIIRSMVDSLAEIVDCRNRPPRQGDGDDGHGLLLDPPDYDRWSDLLETGATLFGPLDWWPSARSAGVRAAIWSCLASVDLPPGERPARRRALFPDAGFAILRSGTRRDEIWCRCDHGPLGFLSTAAHGHADALSIELRVGGVELLVDPGTYCYQGEPRWRAYFRSTLAHNTLRLADRDQAIQAGAFLWREHGRAWLLEASGLEGGPIASWRAAHDGYSRLRPPAIHERRVDLDRAERRITVHDKVSSPGLHPGLLTFHLGPDVRVVLRGTRAELSWRVGDQERGANLVLSDRLDWSTAHGLQDPILGWYSASFGSRQAVTTIVGKGMFGGDPEIRTRIEL